ncbi:amino acid ABC transporter permease [Devosia epidermidihirudinis]|uniref:Amino acid ABC transporter permease n=1 Tax=Devosia epidermidihirudinis TaxID=1293439 RepID=A0A0F5QJ47_9HYPH|nr:ABC transporter permease subunit [Devosia epidermidihirudinis]KKC40990.1 amino acid ABC transporter permease [Devosia epidermidihirudinis]
MTAITEPGRHRPGFLHVLRHWLGPRPTAQFALLFAAIGLFWWFGANTLETMARAGINPGFDFLNRSANFEIGETMIPYSSADPYSRAILVGLLNTIKVAILGCVLATVLGVSLGVARLSGNLLLSGLVRWYIEIIRNTPLLLQLFFWSALTKALPAPRQAISVGDNAFLSNRGIFVPGIIVDNASTAGWIALLVLTILAIATFVGLTRTANLTFWRGTGVIAALVIATALAFALTGATARFEIPALGGFNIRGGYNLSPEFAALLIGLTVKFSAAIAEIVRAGIQSVDRGQWEAARALGLHNGQIMRLIVLPQALRVITPLITTSYLDLTKDSSLAVAIGYPDLVNVINTTANTTGQALEALAILIGVYLALNLSVSAMMNQYNRRVALRGTVQR